MCSNDAGYLNVRDCVAKAACGVIATVCANATTLVIILCSSFPFPLQSAATRLNFRNGSETESETETNWNWKKRVASVGSSSAASSALRTQDTQALTRCQQLWASRPLQLCFPLPLSSCSLFENVSHYFHNECRWNESVSARIQTRHQRFSATALC